MKRRPQAPTIIVSLTPMSLERDTRTLKQASSMARLGYCSIVIEGPPSRSELPPGFKLISSIRPQRRPDVIDNAPTLTGREDAQTMLPGQPNMVACGNARALLEQRLRLPLKGRPRMNRVFYASSNVLRRVFGVERKIRIFALRGVCVIRGGWRQLLSRLREMPISDPARALYHWKEYARLYVVAPLKVTPKASLYYLHAWYQFPAVYLLCLRYHAKFVYDAHDFYAHVESDKSLRRFWRRWVLPFELAIERRCIRQAAAVVTVNEGVARLIENRYGRKAVVLRNSHDSRLETPVSCTIRDRVGLAADDFLIACVGQWKPGMAIKEATAAIASLPERYHLVFVGHSYPPLTELLRRHGVVHRVHFLPAVTPGEIVPFIRTADAGLLLYYPLSENYENCLPNGFFQPLAAGLPILYPKLREIRVLAERYGLGLPIDPLDPHSIAMGIQRLGEESELRAKIRQGVRFASEELSWAREEEYLQDILSALISRRDNSSVEGDSRAGTEFA